MLYYLSNYAYFSGPLRLFGYLSFRAALGVVISLIIGFYLGPKVIALLRGLKMKQGFRDKAEVGRLADLHASKKDTPTMGGLLIYMSVLPSILLTAKLNAYVLVALIVYTGLTFIGFMDDYLKVTKKNSAGLKSIYKLYAQGALTLISVFILLFNPETHSPMSQLWLPFYKYPLIREMPLIMIVVFFFLVVSGTSNAINLTDGVDGLAIGCVIPVVLVYAVMAYVSGNAMIAHYLSFPYIPGVGELAVVCASVLGGSIVFLWYNAHPAEVFMGDTGSLALGGLIGAIAYMVLQPVTLILVGGVFVMEALSVILQVGSFKLRGKRIFKMAPIHHHFELMNWHENKVVIRFWIFSLIFALIGLSTLKLR